MSRRARSRKSPAAFRKIWSIVARIPRGRVATYGQVARLAGFVRGARTAGWALHALPANVRVGGRPVPWHRVINAEGRISPRGGDDEALAVLRQARRLRREGVRFDAAGAIDLGRFGWSPGVWSAAEWRRSRADARINR